jgi:hypothetical protein
VKSRTERENLKHLNCYEPLPGNGRERHSRLEKRSGCCGDFLLLEIVGGAVTACSTESCI